MHGATTRPFADDLLERDTHAAIDVAEARALLKRFATLVRESGSADERTSAEYIVERLWKLGVPVVVHEPELYLSIPEQSELTVTSAGVSRPIESRPPAFSLSTDTEAVSGDIVYVPSKYAGGTGSLFDLPSAATETSGIIDPVWGKIVLTEGFSMPGPVQAFERRGAIGQIYVHPGPRIHEGICTTIWGAPTDESIDRKPRTPVVCIGRPDGEQLAAEAAAGSRATIRTWLREGWMRCLLPVVDIQGQEDPDEFLLVHGHYDSWYEGIGDNATGNAALLELARVLHGVARRLKRSVRIAWWPGHSTGRYAGSTWYADTFADHIDERCIAHLNIDSPGCAGATAYEEVMWMAEAGDLCTRAIADAAGACAQGMRPLRAGDYSFNQIGPTAFYMLLSNIPQQERARRGYYAVGGCGGNVAWHTPQDLIDVADLDVLRADLQVYLTTIIRTVNAPLYPFDYGATIAEITAAVRQHHAAAAGIVDLKPVLDDLESLRAAYTQWRSDAEARVLSADAAERRALNTTLRRLARHLVPLNYVRGERFDHDPAIKFGPVPRFEAAAKVAGAPADMRLFLATRLVRERNKVRAILRAARRELGN